MMAFRRWTYPCATGMFHNFVQGERPLQRLWIHLSHWSQQTAESFCFTVAVQIPHGYFDFWGPGLDSTSPAINRKMFMDIQDSDGSLSGLLRDTVAWSKYSILVKDASDSAILYVTRRADAWVCVLSSPGPNSRVTEWIANTNTRNNSVRIMGRAPMSDSGWHGKTPLCSCI